MDRKAMTSDPAEALSARVLRFALSKASDPDVDQERSTTLALEVLEQLSSSSDSDWETNLRALIEPLALEIIGSPDEWSRILQRLHSYLNRADTQEDHPRRETAFTRTKGEGQVQLFGVPLNLARKLVSRLLVAAEPAASQHFLETLDDWDVIQAVTEVLDAVDLTTRQLAGLLHCADAKTRNNGLRGKILGPIRRKVTDAPDMGQRIVDAWLKAEEWTDPLDLPAISLLIEAVVEGTPQQMDWRDEVIEALVDRRTSEHLGLAAYLACFAWPEPMPPVDERHAALMLHVRRWPPALVEYGLSAMVRETSHHPRHAIGTSIELIECVANDKHDGREVQQRQAQFLAQTCFYAANTLKENNNDLAPVLLALPHLLNHPPPSSQDIYLDGVLETVLRDRPDEVRSFLSSWLLHNQDLLDGRPLDEMLHMTIMELGGDREAEWLTSFMLTADPLLRRIATVLMAHRTTQTPIPVEYLSQLSAEQVLAIAFQLTGSGMPGERWIPALFHIANERADTRTAVVELIQEYAVPDFPGVTKDQLKTWDDGRDGTPSEQSQHSALQAASTVIRARLEERDSVHRKRISLPEMLSTAYSAARWQELWDNRMQAAADEELYSGRHPLTAMIPRVPVCRGVGSQMGENRNDVAKLTHISHSMESSQRESSDRLTATVNRAVNMERAEQLLNHHHRSHD